MRWQSWLERSLPRERLLMGLGCLALALVLLDHGIVGPAWSCPRASMLEGGDVIPGFCADYGDPQGWPSVALGLVLLAAGLLLLARAASGTRFATTLRTALVLGTLGAALAYAAWSLGWSGVCVEIESHGGPAFAPRCTITAEPWQAWALGSGGFLMGAAATLAVGAATLAWPRAASDRR